MPGNLPPDFVNFSLVRIAPCMPRLLAQDGEVFKGIFPDLFLRLKPGPDAVTR